MDKLITFEVAKLITFKWLYVFPYLGLFGAISEKINRTLIEKQMGTSGDKQIISQIFNVISSSPTCFLAVVVFFCEFLGCFFCECWGCLFVFFNVPCSFLMFFNVLLFFYLLC